MGLGVYDAGLGLASMPVYCGGSCGMIGDPCLNWYVCGWLSSKVVIGWLGYANGSADGNIRLLMSTLSPEASVIVDSEDPAKGWPGRGSDAAVKPKLSRLLGVADVGVRLGVEPK